MINYLHHSLDAERGNRLDGHAETMPLRMPCLGNFHFKISFTFFRLASTFFGMFRSNYAELCFSAFFGWNFRTKKRKAIYRIGDEEKSRKKFHIFSLREL